MTAAAQPHAPAQSRRGLITHGHRCAVLWPDARDSAGAEPLNRTNHRPDREAPPRCRAAHSAAALAPCAETAQRQIDAQQRRARAGCDKPPIEQPTRSAVSELQSTARQEQLSTTGHGCAGTASKTGSATADDDAGTTAAGPDRQCCPRLRRRCCTRADTVADQACCTPRGRVLVPRTDAAEQPARLYQA